MAGYCGWSMSNNAVACYDENIKPKSKWLKAELLDLVRETYGEEAHALAKKHSIGFLRDCFLSYDSWHHTGKHFRCTDFYDFSYDLGEESVMNILKEIEVKEEKEIPVPFAVNAEWLEWTGSRRHPRSYEVSGFGRIVGNFFYCTDGTRKRVDGKYFHFTVLDEDQAKSEFKKAFRLKTTHRYSKWLETGHI